MEQAKCKTESRTVVDISTKDLISILNRAPKSATHYVEFNPGDYKSDTFARSDGDMHLFKSQSEMNGEIVKTSSPHALSLSDLRDELALRGE